MSLGHSSQKSRKAINSQLRTLFATNIIIAGADGKRIKIDGNEFYKKSSEKIEKHLVVAENNIDLRKDSVFGSAVTSSARNSLREKNIQTEFNMN